MGKKSNKPLPPPQDHVFIKITNVPAKYAALSGKGDLLVAPKAQAAEFAVTEAPRRQRDLCDVDSKPKLDASYLGCPSGKHRASCWL